MSINPLTNIPSQDFPRFTSEELSHPFWMQNIVGRQKRNILKMHEAGKRARHCAHSSNRRRMRHHMSVFNKLARKAGLKLKTTWICGNELRKHRAVFGQSGTGKIYYGTGFTYG